MIVSAISYSDLIAVLLRVVTCFILIQASLKIMVTWSSVSDSDVDSGTALMGSV